MPILSRIATVVPTTSLFAVACLVALHPWTGGTTRVVVEVQPAQPAAADPGAPRTPLVTPGAFDRIEILEPVVVGSLELSPILLPANPGPMPEMLVLDEAMDAHLVTITETGSVTELLLTNRSDHELVVIAGEVILGGHQDRIIGRNAILGAHVSEVIPVFCVEHSRWSGESNEFVSGHALAHERLRAQASFHQQQDVWDEVASSNQARSIHNSTGTYRDAAARQLDPASQVAGNAVRIALARLTPGQRARFVGFSEAINGKILSVDVFQSPAVFGKLEAKLVNAYLADALGVPAAAGATVPSAGAIREFLATARDAPLSSSSYTTSAGTSEVRHGDHVGTTRGVSNDSGEVFELSNAD